MSLSPFPSSLLLLLLRALLFVLARRFLLRALVHDIRAVPVPAPVGSGAVTPVSLSGEGEDGDDEEEEAEEMLPMPVLTPTMPSARLDPPHQQHGGHTLAARTTFLLTFTESSTLLLIVLFHAADILDPSARMYNFHVSLLSTSLLVLLVAPLLEIELLTSSSKRTSLLLRLTGTLVPYTLYLFCLWRVPLPDTLHTSSFFPSLLARLAVLGTLVLAVLSSLGSCETSALFLASLRPSYWEPLHQDEIAHTEQSLKRVRADIEERRLELSRREAEVSAPSSPSSPTFLTRVFGRSTSHAQESLLLRRELSALSQLSLALSLQLASLRRRRDRLAWAATWAGRVGVGVGRSFGAYCLVRIAGVAYAVLLHSPSSSSPTTPPQAHPLPDLLTPLLTLLPLPLLSSLPPQTLSRSISLLFVGLVVAGNLRLGVGGVARALRLTSRRKVAGVVVLGVGQVVGVYMLSILVQLRSSLPPSPTSPSPLPPQESPSTVPPAAMADPLSLLPAFEVFGPLFDRVFLGSAVLWGVWRGGRGMFGQGEGGLG